MGSKKCGNSSWALVIVVSLVALSFYYSFMEKGLPNIPGITG